MGFPREEGIQGPDPRLENPNLFNSSVIHKGAYCLSLFSGNLLVPRRVFEAVGGFDQNMIGHGGEDAEFGMRLQEAGIPVIFSDEVIGYHFYHERNQERNVVELRVNCSHMATKHNLALLGVRFGRRGESALVYREGVEHV